MFDHPSSAGSTLRVRVMRPGARLLLLLAVLCLETVSLHVPVDLTGRVPAQAKIGDIFAHAIENTAGYSIAAIVLFLMASWPQRQKLYEEWRRSTVSHDWTRWLSFSVALAVLVFAATLSVKLTSVARLAPLWVLLGTWWGAVFTMLLLLAAAFAPPAYWRSLFSTQKTKLVLVLGTLGLIWVITLLSRDSWGLLAAGTIRLSYWLLLPFESNIILDVPTQTLGVNDFVVNIAPACSGYEGIGLVCGFLALYVAMFRHQLRFPNVFILFPVGALSIWVLDSVRIALLISIGAHISPELALHGFHSQAGWLMFLIVTISAMSITHQLPFFRVGEVKSRKSVAPAVRLALALLLPFAALMLGNIATQIIPIEGLWLYGIPAAAATSVFLIYRDVYKKLIERVSWQAIAVGLAVGIIWVATDRGWDGGGPVEDWIRGLSPAGAVLWLALRLFGLVILVPIAEELAFRGYLHRALIARQFETVEVGRFSWVAFAGSTILFALMHSRWLSAGLAGGCYALLMYRSNRLSDPIAAHAASNLVIAVAAVATQTWSLL